MADLIAGAAYDPDDDTDTDSGFCPSGPDSRPI